MSVDYKTHLSNKESGTMKFYDQLLEAHLKYQHVFGETLSHTRWSHRKVKHCAEISPLEDLQQRRSKIAWKAALLSAFHPSPRPRWVPAIRLNTHEYPQIGYSSSWKCVVLKCCTILKGCKHGCEIMIRTFIGTAFQPSTGKNSGRTLRTPMGKRDR